MSSILVKAYFKAEVDVEIELRIGLESGRDIRLKARCQIVGFLWQIRDS